MSLYVVTQPQIFKQTTSHAAGLFALIVANHPPPITPDVLNQQDRH